MDSELFCSKEEGTSGKKSQSASINFCSKFTYNSFANNGMEVIKIRMYFIIV
jgi:hypothetical protein